MIGVEIIHVFGLKDVIMRMSNGVSTRIGL